MAQALILTALVAVITFAAHHLDRVKEHAALIVACALLYLPVLTIAATRSDWKDYALQRPDVKRSILHTAIALGVVLPLFYAGWFAVQIILYHQHIHYLMPREMTSLILGHLVLISLPEEVFFRGYLQGRLNMVWEKKWSVWGVRFGPALIAAALLFALGHLLVEINAYRVLVVFPALMFGMLRESTGSVLAPILAHTVCNVTFILAQHSVTKMPL